MKLYVVRNSALTVTPDYFVQLEVDAQAQTVKASLGFRRNPALEAPDDLIAAVEPGSVADSVLFSYAALKANRPWSERQAYMAGFDWDAARFRQPVPLNLLTLASRFSAHEISRHAWNGNFLVGLNVPFADSMFEECFLTLNLPAQQGGYSVTGLHDRDIELSGYQSSGHVREMLFPSVSVKADAAAVRAGEPATFTLQMLDGAGNPITRNAELFLESVNGFLPVARRRTVNGQARATVLTTGMQAGDTVRLKAGFKFFPGASDAQVRLT